MAERLTPPLTEEQVRELEIGDVVYIDGIIYTFRDAQHIRAKEYLEEGKELPVDLSDQVIYHCAPAYNETEDGYDIFAGGPTTSERCNFLAPKMIRELGVRGIVGKGGMNQETLEAMEEHGCVYFTIPSTSSTIISSIEEVKDRYWHDLEAESIWVLKVDGFGPLTVTMDSHGNDRRHETGDDSFGKTYTI